MLVADLNVLQRFNYIFQTNLYLIHISIYRKIDDSDQAITAYIHEMEDTRPRQRQTNKVERNLRELRVKKKKKWREKAKNRYKIERKCIYKEATYGGTGLDFQATEKKIVQLFLTTNK